MDFINDLLNVSSMWPCKHLVCTLYVQSNILSLKHCNYIYHKETGPNHVHVSWSIKRCKFRDILNKFIKGPGDLPLFL